MWTHRCPAERIVIAVGDGEPCNWCGLEAASGRPSDSGASATRTYLSALALIAAVVGTTIAAGSAFSLVQDYLSLRRFMAGNWHGCTFARLSVHPPGYRLWDGTVIPLNQVHVTGDPRVMTTEKRHGGRHCIAVE